MGRCPTLSRLTPFLGYGSTTIVQVYVPGSRSGAVAEPSPLAPVGLACCPGHRS